MMDSETIRTVYISIGKAPWKEISVGLFLYEPVICLFGSGLCSRLRKRFYFSALKTRSVPYLVNTICLSIAETATADSMVFYRYLLRLLTDSLNGDMYQHPEVLNQYMLWSKMIQADCDS